MPCPYLRHLAWGISSLDALFKTSRLGNGLALDASNLGGHGLQQGILCPSQSQNVCHCLVVPRHVAR